MASPRPQVMLAASSRPAGRLNARSLPAEEIGPAAMQYRTINYRSLKQENAFLLGQVANLERANALISERKEVSADEWHRVSVERALALQRAADTE
eukprot:710230-Pleurochrysis_carterae.AAC.1